MTDLYLTAEQVEELRGMGPLGEEAAYELGLFRASGMLYYFESGGPGADREAMEGRALYALYMANTAKLRAALVYWCENEVYGRAEKIKAIAEALKGIRV